MKKFLFLIVATSLLFSLNTFAQTAEDYSGLQMKYPAIGEKVLVRQVGKTPLFPEYVNYMFTLLIYSSGLILLWVFILAGFDYYTAAGNAGQMNSAKDRIVKAFLGFIILFLSNLLITMINPSLTTMSLEPFVAGFSAENEFGDRIVAQYAIPDFGSISPTATKFVIPKELKGESKLILFEKINLEGRARVENGSSTFVCSNSEDEGCYGNIPKDAASAFYVPIRSGVYIIIKTNGGAEVPFFLSQSAYRNINDIQDIQLLGGQPIGIRVYTEPDQDYGFAIMLFNDPDYDREGVLYFPPTNKTGWWPSENETLMFESIRESNQFQTLVGELIKAGDLMKLRGEELKEFNPKSIRIVKYSTKNYPVNGATLYDQAEYIQSQESKDDSQPNNCQLDSYSSATTKLNNISGDYKKFANVITCANFEATSIRLHQGEAILLHAYMNRDPGKNWDGDIDRIYPASVGKDFIIFYRAAYLKYSDPNLTDNKGIGQCSCQKRNMWTLGIACGVWQPCPNTILNFYKP